MKKFERKDKNEKRRLAFEKRNVKKEINLARYGSESGSSLIMAKTGEFNRRFVAAFMALVVAISTMVLGLNFATKAEDASNAESNIVTNKTLSFNEETGKYDLTLEAYATGKTVEKPIPLDIALVIDQSGSMITGDMGGSYAPVGTNTTEWTVSDATSGEQYYYRVLVDGEYKYYPVQAKAGTIYEKAPKTQTLDTFGRGHDGDIISGNISSFITSGIGSEVHFDVPTEYYGVDANGKMHKVYVITVGGFLKYQTFFYYYTDLGASSGAESQANERKTKISWFDLSTNFDAQDLVKSTNDNVCKAHGVVVTEHWYGNEYTNEIYCAHASLWNGDTTWRDYTYSRYIDYVGQYDSTIEAGNNTRRNYSWFSDGGTVGGDTNVPLYLPTEGYNDLYYIDSNGNQVDISNNINGIAYQETDTIYTGQLYKATGLTRLEALQNSVSSFAEAVGENAKENDVDHRIAVIGFAGNRTPGISVANGIYNYSGYNSKYDYVNTGLFLNGTFKSYKEITDYSPITYTASSNYHYYIKDSGSYVPVYYNSNGNWYRVTGGYPVTQVFRTSDESTSTYNSNRVFYDVIGSYESLNNSNYQNALVPVRDNDQGYFDAESDPNSSSYHTYIADTTKKNGVNDYVDQAIAQFGDYGGTYTSYGIAMANQVFANNPDQSNEPRQRIIIVFTDGEPGASGYDESIAGEALSDGQTSKDSYGATVYTIGLFKSSPSDEVNTFMNNLSSNGDVSKSNVYAGNSYGLSTSLDPSKTYYYTDASDGKTYAVNTNRNGKSSLGWWETVETGTTYYSYLPYEDSSDNRTGRTTFYKKSGSSYSAQYSFDTAETYYIKEGNNYYPVKYEYRWYNSDKKIVDPLMSPEESDSAKVQFFELDNPSATQAASGFYQTASTIEELNNAFTSITQSISGTQLDANAILHDVINTSNFSKTNATISVATVKGTQLSDGTIRWDSPETDPDVSAVWDDTNTNQINVTGFDYSTNYIADGKEANNDTLANQGRKLVVTISGLTPINTGSDLTSNSSAGIYTIDSDTQEEALVASFNSPELDRYPVTLHVGGDDTDATFDTTLTLTAKDAATAKLNDVVVNVGNTRTVFGSNDAVWKSNAENNDVVYLEYIQNGTEGTTASDYTLATNLTPTASDKDNYTYYWSLSDGGTQSPLTTNAISLGDANEAKHVYINSETNSQNVKLNLTADSSPYVDTNYEFKVDITLSGNNIADKLNSVTTDNPGISFTADGTDTLKATITMPYKADGTIDPVDIKVPDGAVLSVAHSDYFYTTDPIKYTDADVTSQTEYTAHAIIQATNIYINDTHRDNVGEGIAEDSNPMAIVMYALGGIFVISVAGTGAYIYRRKREEQ